MEAEGRPGHALKGGNILLGRIFFMEAEIEVSFKLMGEDQSDKIKFLF